MVIRAIQDVAQPSFLALLVIAISFLPVVTLQQQEGRLFGPLAYTKTLCILVAALLTVTLDPALRLLLFRTAPFTFRPSWLSQALSDVMVRRSGRMREDRIDRWLIAKYEPVVWWTLANKKIVLMHGGNSARDHHPRMRRARI